MPAGLFIDNEFVQASNTATLDVENPSTGTCLATVAVAQKEDVERVVVSSKRAYTTWKTTDPSTKRNLLNELVDLMEQDVADLVSLEAPKGGVFFRESLGLYIAQSVDNLRYFVGWADKVAGDSLSILEGIAIYDEILSVYI